MTPPRIALTWGNCQAAPVGALLAPVLAGHGIEVVEVAPVFLIDEDGLRRVQELVARSVLLISQPIRDEYRIPGCGTAQLAGHLPADAQLLTFPVVFHVGPFPYQVNAHGGDGARVDAPLTDYHDLRAIVAAERGLTLEAALQWWPTPTADAVRTQCEASLAQMRTREETLDVTVSTVLDAPAAMWTISHPSNATLAHVADAVLARLGIADRVEVPQREFVGAVRAPVEPAVVEALGWPESAVRADWAIGNVAVEAATVLQAHLELYRSRPDIVVDARERYGPRLAVLGL